LSGAWCGRKIDMAPMMVALMQKSFDASSLSDLEFDFSGGVLLPSPLRHRRIIFAQRITASIGCWERLLGVFLLAQPLLFFFTSLEPGF
jgi:hypothetical protein